MVGVIRFDRLKTLDRAMTRFWHAGYAGTSIQDLEDATGLGRGSLYNSFGDKQKLFVASLQRYWETIGSDRLSTLAHPDPFIGLQSFLHAVVEQMGNKRHPRGCLFTNTSLECPSAPDIVLRVIAERMNGMETAIHSLLARGRAVGVLNSKADLRALARFYVSVVKGIGVLHKVHGDAGMLRDVAKVAMSAWPHPAGRARGLRRRGDV
jgi:TetR/AcrR family transcriptional regulator, transcriptional repressor for nem operon